jgi:pyruvate formate lyase activating enzyme
MDQMTARIYKVESLNTYNGPGYRTVVYTKGCPLSCDWCHNPEGISRSAEIWIKNSTCIGCQTCVETCPVDALSLTVDGIKVDRDICDGCFDCAEVCPTKSIEKLGEEISVDDLFSRIVDDKAFMDTSGGGVTLTGGEPGEFPDFVEAFFMKCRDNGIHTAFDTSGYVSEKALQKILPFTDLIFFDLKILDEENAKSLTGKGVKHILKSLTFIKEYILINGAPELQFRTPIIPGSTDDPKNINAMAELLGSEYGGLFSKWEFCMFNDICEDKYLRMDMDWNYKGKKYSSSDFKKLTAIQEKFPQHNIEFSGFLSN